MWHRFWVSILQVEMRLDKEGNSFNESIVYWNALRTKKSPINLRLRTSSHSGEWEKGSPANFWFQNLIHSLLEIHPLRHCVVYPTRLLCIPHLSRPVFIRNQSTPSHQVGV